MITVEQRLFREMGAGGYSRHDHRMEYIVRVNALLRPDMRVMEFGAGRGKWSDDPVPLRRHLGDFRGRCAHVVACDVDEAVLGNKSADAVELIGHDGVLPFPDGSFDLISAFSVLEHIEHPEVTATELGRVLAPGGWLCAWTPNRWGYVGVGARLVPKRLHARVLRLVEPRRVEIDSFVPLYTMNTEAARKRLFPTDRFEHFTYSFDGQPFYHGENIVLGKFWELLFRLTPGPFKGYHMVFIRKRT